MATGAQHSLVVAANEDVYAFGLNDAAQLGPADAAAAAAAAAAAVPGAVAAVPAAVPEVSPLEAALPVPAAVPEAKAFDASTCKGSFVAIKQLDANDNALFTQPDDAYCEPRGPHADPPSAATLRLYRLRTPSTRLTP